MHFRKAPWALLALAPAIILAFWPSYFGDLAHASLAFHAHGLTATAWLALIAFQSVSIQWRDRRWHRLAGRAVFVLIPLFTGAAVLVMHSMATKFANGSVPFYAALGARLGLHDLISTVVLVAMVCAALLCAERRRSTAASCSRRHCWFCRPSSRVYRFRAFSIQGRLSPSGSLRRQLGARPVLADPS